MRNMVPDKIRFLLRRWWGGACSAVLTLMCLSAPAVSDAQAIPDTQTLPPAVWAHPEDHAPEAGTGVVRHELQHAPHYMFSSAHPLATAAGAQILAEGGTAADAVIAAQWVLSLVEPQSSGLGGGGFAISYDALTGQLTAYDGRETAPRAAKPDRFTEDGKVLEFWDAVHSGRSVGVPGLVAMLAAMHERDGGLRWARLFQNAIALAEEGFEVSPRLHRLLAENKYLRQQPAAAAYFYDESGQAWPVGHKLKNLALAKTLRTLAEQGPDAFYKGEIAEHIVDAVARHLIPGDMSLEDMASYKALNGPPLCAPYKIYQLCGPPPPSAGPLTVMQILSILEHTPIEDLDPLSAEAIHYFSEAGKLAFADRDHYVADPDFIDVPVTALLDEQYLQSRAELIQSDRAMGRAQPGELAGLLAQRGEDRTPELPSTTHLVAVDKDGNMVSMTTSVETAFGSKIFVDGFLLNNQLTDFSLSSIDAQGRLVANRVEARKRPRSSMAPMLVLKDDTPIMAIGSPGGSSIINYVAQTLVAVLDWGLDLQSAIDLPHYGSRNRFTELEKQRGLDAQAQALRAMGHEVRQIEFTSGLHGVMRGPHGWVGAADPRREGRARGG